MGMLLEYVLEVRTRYVLEVRTRGRRLLPSACVDMLLFCVLAAFLRLPLPVFASASVSVAPSYRCTPVPSVLSSYYVSLRNSTSSWRWRYKVDRELIRQVVIFHFSKQEA